MSHDDIDHIPTITATRDSDHQRSRPQARGAKPGNGGRKPVRPASANSSSGGAGIWARLFITVSLVVAGVACAWAWQLQQQLEQYQAYMSPYESRISDLEDRLSDTDEGLSQNTATMAVKIKELDSEVDKLWAARNVNRKKISALETQDTTTTKKVASLSKSVTADQAQLKSLAGDIAKLRGVAGDLQRLMTSAKSNQAEVERVADTLNRMNLEYAKLDRRVKTNEEWVGSVNAFRRQVNTTMSQLQASIRALETVPQ
jgi:chromosome segregation ATPase